MVLMQNINLPPIQALLFANSPIPANEKFSTRSCIQSIQSEKTALSLEGLNTQHYSPLGQQQLVPEPSKRKRENTDVFILQSEHIINILH